MSGTREQGCAQAGEPSELPCHHGKPRRLPDAACASTAHPAKGLILGALVPSKGGRAVVKPEPGIILASWTR